MESKLEVQKTLSCTMSRGSTAECKGTTRFRNTSVDAQEIIVTKMLNRNIASRCKKQNQTSKNQAALL